MMTDEQIDDLLKGHDKVTLSMQRRIFANLIVDSCETDTQLAELIEAGAAMRAAQKDRSVRGNAVQHLEYAFDKLLLAITNPPAPNLFG